MYSKAPAAWLAALALAFTGPAQARITVDDDASGGDYTVVHQSDFDLDHHEGELSPSTLLASKTIKADGSTVYMLVITTNAARVADGRGGYAAVPPDRATWLIDGRPTRLGSAVANREVQGAFVRATFYVSLGREEFETLANASSAVIAVGDDRYAIGRDALAEIRQVAGMSRP